MARWTRSNNSSSQRSESPVPSAWFSPSVLASFIASGWRVWAVFKASLACGSRTLRCVSLSLLCVSPPTICTFIQKAWSTLQVYTFAVPCHCLGSFHCSDQTWSGLPFCTSATSGKPFHNLQLGIIRIWGDLTPCPPRLNTLSRLTHSMCGWGLHALQFSHPFQSPQCLACESHHVLLIGYLLSSYACLFNQGNHGEVPLAQARQRLS